MQRTLLSLAAVAAAAASLSAQCVLPATNGGWSTTTAGAFIYGAATPPLYGVSQDPGPAVRCNMQLETDVFLTSFRVALLDDGTTIAGIPTSNLVALAGSKVEIWTMLGGDVHLATNYGTYTRVPLVNPPGAWVKQGEFALTVAGQGVYSTASLIDAGQGHPSGIQLATGNYAIECVLVAPYVLPAGTDTIRHHVRMNNVPGTGLPLLYGDQFMKIASTGSTDPAFTAGAVDDLTAGPQGPFTADMGFDYVRVNTNVAHSTPYGKGCYDSNLTFYQTFVGAASSAGTTPAFIVANPILEMLPIGAPITNYLVQPGTGTYPLHGAPGAGADGTRWFDVNRVGQPSHVNNGVPAVTDFGDWDDSNSTPYDLPFAIQYPGGSSTQIVINSNGAIYLGGDPNHPTRRGTATWLMGAPVFASAFADLYVRDGNLLTGGTGEIFIEVDPAVVPQWVTVSFVGVSEYNNFGFNTSGNNWQVEFNANGTVRYAYGTYATSAGIANLIGFTPGNGGLTYTPPTGSPDPGTGAHPRTAPNLAIPFLSGNGAFPATLTIDKTPRVGNNLLLRTNNMMQPGTIQFGTFVSFGSFPAGFNLGFFPGPSLSSPNPLVCNLYITLPELMSALGPTGGQTSQVIDFGPIPASALGYVGYAQSVAIHITPGGAPLLNDALGGGFAVLPTNGLCMTVGNL